MIHHIMQAGPPHTKEIKGYIHCKKCEESCPAGMSYQEWADVEVGFTPYGLQLWCHRHGMNIAHFDFRGTKVITNMSAAQGGIWPVTH